MEPLAEADFGKLSSTYFQLWTTNALKVFLRLRKKKTDGTFDELAARYIHPWMGYIDIVYLYKSEKDVVEAKTTATFFL